MPAPNFDSAGAQLEGIWDGSPFCFAPRPRQKKTSVAKETPKRIWDRGQYGQTQGKIGVGPKNAYAS